MTNRPTVTFEGAVGMASHILLVTSTSNFPAKSKGGDTVTVKILKVLHRRLDWTPKQIELLHIPHGIKQGTIEVAPNPEVLVGKEIKVRLRGSPSAAKIIVLITNYVSNDGVFECDIDWPWVLESKESEIQSILNKT